MNAVQTSRVAVRALMRNKVRSALTMLGIIIGVFAVIAMVAIGEGAKAQVSQSFASMGSNILIVLSGSSSRGGSMGGFGSQPTLTWDDLKAIRAEVSAAKYVAAQLRSNAQVMSEEQNWSTSITGTSPEFFEIRTWKASTGSLFTQSDVDSGTKVVVLGQTVVDKLFGPNSDPVGQTVRIKNMPFFVMGVLEKKGQSANGQDNDDAAFVPQTTFMSKIQGGLQKYLNGMIIVSATSAEAIPRAQTQISALLRDRHHTPDGQDDDFNLRNMTEMAGAVESGTATLTNLLAAIAAVSLLVGGIGIMNIMLVSVTERTREIGVRMAVGARPRDILAQFLVEAVVLSVTGGLVGIGLGLAVAQVAANKLGWPMVYRPDIIIIAVGFSALVGIGFGLYPAFKASRLDPIDALRFE
jgi:putative ABC transport system permease protein